jgi:sensor histidine kinase YesM
MKTRGIKDLYLPQNVAIHLKIVLSTFVIGLVWGLIIKVELNQAFFIFIVPILIFDLEIAYLIIVWFKKLNKKYGHRLNETSSINKLVFLKLLGHLLFLVLFLGVNIIGVSLYLIISHSIKGLGFPDLLSIINENNLVKATTIGLSFSIPFFFFQKWIETLKREHKLKEQNLIFQNETLKSQVNPHFLFNSLNTLTSLINNEIETANQFVGKLSLIYRYILDNSTKTKISLKEEIDFIRDYFYMHQIRNEGKINLTIDIKESEYEYEILPVSLQLLVENAIKHNMATAEKPLTIHIYLEDGYIVVINNIQKMATQIVSTKIGLKNLSERVRLVTGKEIIISESEEKFIVKVPLMT